MFISYRKTKNLEGALIHFCSQGRCTIFSRPLLAQLLFLNYNSFLFIKNFNWLNNK